MGLNSELLEKAKQAGTAEEILSLAKENGVELTEEEAKEYFEQLHRSGELSDEELDNVAGGGCHKKDGRLIVTIKHSCPYFSCIICGKSETHFHADTKSYWYPSCEVCRHMSYEKGLWLCNNENNMK